MDSSINPHSGNESDMSSTSVELPVDIDSVTIDGTAPEIGDQVDLKVTGNVTRVVNTIAYVKPSSINDQPVQEPAINPNPALDEESRLERLSHSAGMIGQ